jgi:hypothetical protein
VHSTVDHYEQAFGATQGAAARRRSRSGSGPRPRLAAGVAVVGAVAAARCSERGGSPVLAGAVDSGGWWPRPQRRSTRGDVACSMSDYVDIDSAPSGRAERRDRLPSPCARARWRGTRRAATASPLAAGARPRGRTRAPATSGRAPGDRLRVPAPAWRHDDPDLRARLPGVDFSCRGAEGAAPDRSTGVRQDREVRPVEESIHSASCARCPAPTARRCWRRRGRYAALAAVGFWACHLRGGRRLGRLDAGDGSAVETRRAAAYARHDSAGSAQPAGPSTTLLGYRGTCGRSTRAGRARTSGHMLRAHRARAGATPGDLDPRVLHGDEWVIDG